MPQINPQGGQFRKHSKEKNFLLVIFTVFILVFLSYFIWQGFFSPVDYTASINQGNLLIKEESQTAEDEGLSIANISNIFRLIKKITLDMSILKDWKFSSLIEYGRSPQVKEKGRVNPFDPY